MMVLIKDFDISISTVESTDEEMQELDRLKWKQELIPSCTIIYVVEHYCG